MRLNDPQLKGDHGKFTVYFISGTHNNYPKEIFGKVLRYRHQVFIERLGWDLPTNGKYEQDQFDRSDAFYVTALDVDNCVIGCARLLPTSKPYLLSEVFPQILNGQTPPRSSKIWELSRFAAIDLRYPLKNRNRALCSTITLELLRNVIMNARLRGAKRLITVSPSAVERLLRSTRYKHHRAGQPVIVNNKSLMAFWIDCNKQ
jgi:acyl homoserine lactone synthase